MLKLRPIQLLMTTLVAVCFLGGAASAVMMFDKGQPDHSVHGVPTKERGHHKTDTPHSGNQPSLNTQTQPMSETDVTTSPDCSVVHEPNEDEMGNDTSVSVNCHSESSSSSNDVNINSNSSQSVQSDSGNATSHNSTSIDVDIR